jgi:hypothetical protein
VDGTRAGLAGNIDDLVAAQVGFARRGWSQAVSLVGIAHVKRLAVGIRINCHGLDAQLPAGAQDAHSNLPSVGYQCFIKTTSFTPLICSSYKGIGG